MPPLTPYGSSDPPRPVNKEARNFEFARDNTHKDGYLMHKYQPDCAIGSTWHPLCTVAVKNQPSRKTKQPASYLRIGEYFESTGDHALSRA